MCPCTSLPTTTGFTKYARLLRRGTVVAALATIISVPVLLVDQAKAGSLTWGVGGQGDTGTWDAGTAVNWWNGSANVVWPGTGTDNDAVFNDFAGAITLGTGGVSANDLTFTVSGYTISSNSSADTLTLNGATPTITTDTNVIAVINSVIAGTSGLRKAGEGTLALSGANAFTGGVNVLGGALQLDSSAALGSGNSIVLGGSGSISPTVVINANSTNLGPLIVSAGVTDAAISMTQNSGTWSHTINGATLSSPLNINQSSTTGLNWDQITWTSKITGNGGGSGNDTLIFNNTSTTQNYFTMGAGVVNDFSGNIHVKTGRVIAQSGSAGSNFLIPDASMLIVDGRWDWNVQSFVETIDGLAGTGIFTGNAGGTSVLTINANNAANNAGRVYSGTFGSGGASSVTLGGSGTQEFSGSGITYSGVTNLNNGTLKLTKTTGWNSNIAVGTANSPTLQLNSALAADTWTFSKQINGGSTNAKIEKVGLGTVVLSPAAGSTFVGNSSGAITVTNGRLYLNTNLATAPSVSVGGGATFGGTATVGAITVANGGTLEGGFNGGGTLTVGNLTLGASAADTSTLAGTLSTSAGYKALSVTSLTINGGNQSVLLNAAGLGLSSGTYYDLLVSANVITAPNASGVLAALKSNSRAYTPAIANGGTTIQLYYDANASVYWTGASGTAWNATTTNWKLSGNNANTQFLPGDVVLFNDNPAAATVDISNGNVAPLSTSFNNSTTAYTLQGNNSITTGVITKNGAGTLTITNDNPTSGAVALNGGTVTISQSGGLGTGHITFGGGNLAYSGTSTTWARNLVLNAAAVVDVSNIDTTLTENGVVSGSGNLVKAGNGTLVLSGANTFTGSVTISRGAVIGNNTQAFGASNSVTLGDANTGANDVEFKLDTAISGTMSLASIDNSNFGNSRFITMNAGAALGPNVPVLATTLNLNGTGAVTLRGTNTGAHTTRQDVNWRIAGSGIPAGTTALVLDGSAFAIRTSQLSNTSEASNFNGDVLILGDVTTQGRTYLDNSASNQNLNFLNNDVTVSADANWRVVWGGETVGALNGSGTVTLNCQNALNNVGLTIGNNNRNGAFAGALGGGVWQVTKTGTGIQEFSGAGLTYSSSTNLNGGTLKLTNTGAWASNVVLAATGNPNLQLNAPSASDLWSLVSQIIGGSASANVEKVGAGTVILGGTSSYTGGATVSAGTLLVNGSLGGSLVTVNNSGTLGGTGTVGATLVNVGGTLAPGESIGTLNVSGSLTLAGTAVFEIDKTGLSLTSDLANVTGVLTLGGTLTVTATGDALASGDTFNLFDAGGFSGSFTALNLPALDPGLSWNTSSLAVNGTLTVVPEPGSMASLLSGCCAVLLGLRRRRS